ncbi:MAG: hypothetical protein ACKO01_10640 [Erythrobacter sp.]
MIGDTFPGSDAPEPHQSAGPALGAAHNAEVAAIESLEDLLAHALAMADALGLQMVGIDISSALERMRQPGKTHGSDGAV